MYVRPVAVDGTNIGGSPRNMSNAKRAELAGTGRGPVGYTVTVGAKYRSAKQATAKEVKFTHGGRLRDFVEDPTRDGASEQMQSMRRGMEGKRLTHEALIRDNGDALGAQC